MAENILEVKDLKVHFPVKHKRNALVRAVDGVSFTLGRGEILSLVGESGSGKTTTGKAVLRIIEPTAGSIRFMGEEIGAARVDNVVGHDLPHRLARLIGFIAALTSLALYLLLPAVCAGDGSSVSGLGLTLNAASNAAVYGVGTGAAALSALVIVSALCCAALCISVKKRPALAALPAGAGLLFALMILLSLNKEVSLGWGIGGVMIGFAAAALFLVITPRFYTPAFEKQLRRHAQMIYQDPYQSLNPRQYIIDIVAEPLEVNGLVTTPEEREAAVQTALERAGLQPARDYFYRYPYELSGGQRQRVAIAATLILEPDFIVADEPVSMIDASIRLGIIKLMKKMQQENGIAFLFITHDLSLAWLISDRIAIMYLGKIMEIGTADQIIKDCRHPYAKALMDVMPIPGMAREGGRMILKGDIPSAASEITGCKFHSRCPYATEICSKEEPGFTTVDEGHFAACHNLGKA